MYYLAGMGCIQLEIFSTPTHAWMSRVTIYIYNTSFVKLTIKMLHELTYIFTHLKLCLATATHNFKWVKMPNSIEK